MMALPSQKELRNAYIREWHEINGWQPIHEECGQQVYWNEELDNYWCNECDVELTIWNSFYNLEEVNNDEV